MFAISFYLLKAYSGVATCSAFAIETYISYLYDKKERKIPLWLVLVMIVVSTTIASLFYQSWVDLLAILSCIPYVLILIQKKEKFVRFWTFINMLLYTVYDILAGAYTAFIGDALFEISTIIAIIRYDLIKREEGITMSVRITYFVHGTTTDNEQKLSTGWVPGELSEKGIEQSKELANLVNINEFDLVISSDLKRAIDSAELTFKNLKEIKHDSRLRECNYGDLNGKPAELVKYEEHILDPFPNGEALKDVEKRIKDFCNYLLENYDGKHIAIVAHKAPQFAFQVITQNKTWEEAIEEDWRKTKSWQPGWEYIVK